MRRLGLIVATCGEQSYPGRNSRAEPTATTPGWAACVAQSTATSGRSAATLGELDQRDAAAVRGSGFRSVKAGADLPEHHGEGDRQAAINRAGVSATARLHARRMSDSSRLYPTSG
jgi:hypothetical protein